jgi:hypothetical protein
MKSENIQSDRHWPLICSEKICCLSGDMLGWHDWSRLRTDSDGASFEWFRILAPDGMSKPCLMIDRDFVWLLGRYHNPFRINLLFVPDGWDRIWHSFHSIKNHKKIESFIAPWNLSHSIEISKSIPWLIVPGIFHSLYIRRSVQHHRKAASWHQSFVMPIPILPCVFDARARRKWKKETRIGFVQLASASFRTLSRRKCTPKNRQRHDEQFQVQSELNGCIMSQDVFVIESMFVSLVCFHPIYLNCRPDFRFVSSQTRSLWATRKAHRCCLVKHGSQMPSECLVILISCAMRLDCHFISGPSITEKSKGISTKQWSKERRTPDSQSPRTLGNVARPVATSIWPPPVIPF